MSHYYNFLFLTNEQTNVNGFKKISNTMYYAKSYYLKLVLPNLYLALSLFYVGELLKMFRKCITTGLNRENFSIYILS